MQRGGDGHKCFLPVAESMILDLFLSMETVVFPLLLNAFGKRKRNANP